MHRTPPTFEELGHLSALVRYETDLPDGDAPRLLAFDEVRDQAWVSVDGMAVGTMSRTLHERSIMVPPGRAALASLVEEQGRVNYASRIGEHKGLIGVPDARRRAARRLDGDAHRRRGAGTFARRRRRCRGARVRTPGPVILSGRFELDEPADLFLDTGEWGAGFAVVNGFLLGRYRRTGPQRTLYVPAPLVRAGENTIVVIELEHVTAARAVFVAQPELGPSEE